MLASCAGDSYGLRRNSQHFPRLMSLFELLTKKAALLFSESLLSMNSVEGSV